MTTAEQIYAEALLLPEDMAKQVLDFILFLEQRYPLVSTGKKTGTVPGEIHEPEPQILVQLLANPFPPKGDGLPMKREEMYDRSSLR